MGVSFDLEDLLDGPTDPVGSSAFQTPIPAQRQPEFDSWVRQNQINDLDHPDSHYDYRGAFMAGIQPDPSSGHWPDTFKQPGHQTFSTESQYAAGRTDAGTWDGDRFVPPNQNVAPPASQASQGSTFDLEDLLGPEKPKPTVVGSEYPDRPEFTGARLLGRHPVGEMIPPEEIARQEKLASMTTGERAAEFGKGMAEGAEGLVTFPVDALKPVLAASPEEEQNPLVRAFAAAKAGGPTKAPALPMPGTAAPAEGMDLAGQVISGLNPEPLARQIVHGALNRDPHALGLAAGFEAGGKALGAIKEAAGGAMERAQVRGEEAVGDDYARAVAPMSERGDLPQPTLPPQVKVETGNEVATTGNEPQAFELDDLLKQGPIEGHPEPPAGLTQKLLDLGLDKENVVKIVTGRSVQRAEEAPAEGRRVESQGPPEGMPERRLGARRAEVQPPIAEAPAAVSPEAGFEDFAREYRQHFADMQKYGPDQVGSQVFAEKMAKMEEAHPDWAARVESEGAPASKPPVEAPPLAPEPPTLEQPKLAEPFTSHEIGKTLSILNETDYGLLQRRNDVQRQLDKIPEDKRSHPTAQSLADDLDVLNEEIKVRGGLQGAAEELAANQNAEGQPIKAPEPPLLAPESTTLEPPKVEKPILGTKGVTDVSPVVAEINARRERQRPYYEKANEAMIAAQGDVTKARLILRAKEREATHAGKDDLAELYSAAEESLITADTPRMNLQEAEAVEPLRLGPGEPALEQPKVAPKKGEAAPYRVWTPKTGYTEMPGAKPAKLSLPPGFENMQFVVHKAVGQPGWSVTEASTGANVGLGKTRAAAIETATKALTTVGPESTRKAIEQTTAKIKAGEAARNGEPVPEPTPADPIEALRQHAQAIAVTEKAIEHGKGADGEPFTPEQIDGFKKDAADQRAQLEQKIEQHAEVNGLKEAEKLRGQIWNEIKNTEVETPKPPVASINPKFKKLDNDALVARQVELEDRIQKDQAILNKGVTPWVRDDPNMDITAPGTTKRTGTSWSRSAMYAKGRINQSGRLLDEVLAEVKDRKITPDEHAGMEDAAKERAAMAAEENAKADAAEFDEHETTGPEAGFVVPDMLKPTKIVAALYKRMNETEVSDAVKRIFAPASRSPEAAEGAQIVRQRMGEQAHDFEVAKMALGQARKDVPLLTTPQGLDFTDAIELGQQQATVKLTAAHQGIRAALDKARQDVQDLGTGKLEEFNENYLGHIWEKNQGTFAQIFGRRPLEGSKAFLKQRTIPTIREGIDQGLVPVVDNPVDMVLLKVREMNRYVMAHRILADFKEQGLAKFVKAGQQAPDGWARINDKIATVYAPRTEEGAMAIRGEYWSPEPVARILNNHLSPGLRGNPLYDAYMGLGNVMNQAQLGLSAFHLGFTSLDAAISRAALAVLHVSERDFPAAIRTALSVPAAPITNILKGNKVLQEYLRPGTQGAEVARVVDGLIKAGGRVKMDEMFKNNAVESFLKAVRRQPLQTAAKGVAGAVIGGALGGPVGAVAGAAFMTKAMGAALELAAKPLMEKIVPRQKLGVFFDLAQFELSRLPADATDAQVREVMARAWNSVDNRMGQVVYDNHFWNKALKDLAHASIRSVGWNWGTASELGGGVKDLSQGKMTPRASYTLALPVTVGLLGALTTYLYTGEGPQDLKDYFYPRTGRKNPEGDDERLALPSYMKDIFSYERHPVTTLGHKLHPLIGTASEMLNNQDFYGDQIRNPHDPVVVQAQDAAEYLAKQFIPFGVRGAMQGGQEGQSRATQAGSFVGVTPAPREVVRSPAENEVAQYLAEHRPAVRTREEAAKGKNRADLRRSLRTGDAGVDQIVEQIQSGALTRDQGRTLLRENEEDPSFTRFKMLPVDIAERVYRMGSEEERAVWRPAFAEKIRHAEDAAAQASALKAFDLPYKESYRAIGRMAR